jgi:hypothetical protein
VNDAPHRPFPWRVTAIVAAVVLVASVVGGVLLTRDRVETAQPDDASVFTPAPQVLPLEKQRQLTVLLVVRDAEHVAVSSVLIGVGGDTGFVSELMLPRDLLLPTVPPIRLEQATDPTGSQTADQPLETLLGVQVDAVVDLDRLAWAGLIDATGSRVDTATAQRPEAFALVLDPVLRGLPADESRIGGVLTGLGSMARTTVTNDDASYLLALVGTNLRTRTLQREALPVTYLRSGADRVAVADQAASAEVVQRLFPQALLKPGHAGQPRAVIQRAGATLGQALVARTALVGSGFGVVEDRTPAADATSTVVLVPDGSAASLDAGARAAEALGLAPTAVRVDTGSGGVVDVRIVLGSDQPPM